MGVSAACGRIAEYIAPMPLADFDLKVTMTYEGSVAIDYPSVSVEHTVAAGVFRGHRWEARTSEWIGNDVLWRQYQPPTYSTIILKEDWDDVGAAAAKCEIEGSVRLHGQTISSTTRLLPVRGDK